MNDKRLESIEGKIDKLTGAFSDYRVKSEGRITRIETIQKGFLTLLGTALASFVSGVVYLTGGK